MKKIIILTLFLLCQNTSFSKEMILDQLNNPNFTNQSQEWYFITDQVMGGISSGKIEEKIISVFPKFCSQISLIQFLLV